MERDISVVPTEITRPVKVVDLQSWSQIFRSEQTEMVRSISCTNRNYRNFGWNGKHPVFLRLCVVMKNEHTKHLQVVVLVKKLVYHMQTTGKTLSDCLHSSKILNDILLFIDWRGMD